MKKKINTRRSEGNSYKVVLLVVILGCLGTVLGFGIGAARVAEYGGIGENLGLVIISTLCGAQIGFCGTGLVALFVRFLKEVVL